MRRLQSRMFADPVRRAKKNEYYRLKAKTPKAVATRARYRARVREQMAGRPKPDKCEICGRGGKIHFDHCHLTGAFRGWLCGNCNLTLGRVHENPKVLRALADYIERHNAYLRQGDWVEKVRTETALTKHRFVPRKSHGKV